MSLRIAPPSSHSTSATNTSSNTAKGAPSVPGLHDTLRSSLSSTNDTTTPHPAHSNSHPPTLSNPVSHNGKQHKTR
ncbi:hypothetical protein ABVK25_001010 [Lepraria finkii]|uniref:Uncharacterized protein n=1 Tax=Lepraria finkii TaxID=1340010 RepID=A0ABR4BKD9_9LECA